MLTAAHDARLKVQLGEGGLRVDVHFPARNGANGRRPRATGATVKVLET